MPTINNCDATDVMSGPTTLATHAGASFNTELMLTVTSRLHSGGCDLRLSRGAMTIYEYLDLDVAQSASGDAVGPRSDNPSDLPIQATLVAFQKKPSGTKDKRARRAKACSAGCAP